VVLQPELKNLAEPYRAEMLRIHADLVAVLGRGPR
jgi:hypothetical protein